MTPAPTEASLRETFADWTNALNGGQLEKFFGYFHEKSNILDEDFPWTLSKADFIDHLGFHVGSEGNKGLWEFFKWLPREEQYLVVGSTGHVAGLSTFRGKVRDTGFRQRFMGFTLTWAFDDGRWQLLCWHQSVLAGRIAGASPA